MKKQIAVVALLLAVQLPSFSQEQEKLKIAYIDSTKIIGHFLITKESIDKKIKEVAEKNSIDLILQDSIAASPDIDITQQLNSIIRNGGELSISPGFKDDSSLIRVSFINLDKLNALLGFVSSTDKSKAIPVLNEKIKEFSLKNSLDVVIQDAVYISKGMDCTDYLYSFIKDGTLQPLGNRAGFIFAEEKNFGFINTFNLLKSYPLAREAEMRLKGKFQDREERLRELQKSGANNFKIELEKFQKDLFVAKRDEMQEVQKKLNADLMAYREKNNYQVILKEAVFVSSKVNITDNFLSKLQ